MVPRLQKPWFCFAPQNTERNHISVFCYHAGFVRFCLHQVFEGPCLPLSSAKFPLCIRRTGAIVPENGSVSSCLPSPVMSPFSPKTSENNGEGRRHLPKNVVRTVAGECCHTFFQRLLVNSLVIGGGREKKHLGNVWVKAFGNMQGFDFGKSPNMRWFAVICRTKIVGTPGVPEPCAP